MRRELNKHKLQKEDLVALSKGDSRKFEIAELLRKATTMTVKWIA